MRSCCVVLCSKLLSLNKFIARRLKTKVLGRHRMGWHWSCIVFSLSTEAALWLSAVDFLRPLVPEDTVSSYKAFRNFVYTSLLHTVVKWSLLELLFWLVSIILTYITTLAVASHSCKSRLHKSFQFVSSSDITCFPTKSVS